MISLILVFTWLQEFNKINTIKTKLREVANYVASEIISLSALYNLGESSNTYYYVKLSIPRDIDGYAYNLTIEKQNGKYYLKAYLNLKTWVSTQVELSFSEGGHIVLNYDEKGEIDNTGIFYAYEISSAYKEPLIVCFSDQDKLHVSLGYRG